MTVGWSVQWVMGNAVQYEATVCVVQESIRWKGNLWWRVDRSPWTGFVTEPPPKERLPDAPNSEQSRRAVERRWNWGRDGGPGPRGSAKTRNRGKASRAEYQGGADGTGAHQGEADWTGSHQGGTDGTGAHQGEAERIGAHQGKADGTGAHQGGTDRTRAHQCWADGTGSHQGWADETGVHQGGADGTGAHQGTAGGTGAPQGGAGKTGAHQDGADETGALQAWPEDHHGGAEEHQTRTERTVDHGRDWDLENIATHETERTCTVSRTKSENIGRPLAFPLMITKWVNSLLLETGQTCGLTLDSWGEMGETDVAMFVWRKEADKVGSWRLGWFYCFSR